MNVFRLVIALFLVALPSTVWAAGAPVQADAEQSASVLHVYGPGGPLPAMKEAADTFSKEKHVHVVVTGGPLPKWLHDAQQKC
jgi:accessory colonization factor AcfC